MAVNSTLHLKIEGPSERILAKAFARALTDSLAILDDIGRRVTRRNNHSPAPIAWYVTKLESASATAVLVGEPTLHNVDTSVVDHVGNSYVDGLRGIEANEGLPKFMSESSLDKLKHIALPLGEDSAQYFEVAWLNSTRNETKVTRQALLHLGQLRMSRTKSIGSITGALDALSLHGRNRFQVYDDVSQRPVTVEFKPEELGQVKDALGKRVVVFGIISRNSIGQPIRIDEPSLKIMPSGRPLTSIIGIAPDFLGDQTMLEYMRSIG